MKVLKSSDFNEYDIENLILKKLKFTPDPEPCVIKIDIKIYQHIYYK